MPFLPCLFSSIPRRELNLFEQKTHLFSKQKETKNTRESPDADDSQGPPIKVGPSRPGPPRPVPSATAPPNEKPLCPGPPRPITYDDDEEEDLPLHQRRAQAQQQTKLQPAKSTGKASLAYQKTVGGKLKLKNVNMKG